MCIRDRDEDINFVYVASPNSLHFEHALKALKAGKNVICEKPFTSTVKEFDCLVKEAQARHLYLFEAIVTAHMPNYLRMKEEMCIRDSAYTMQYVIHGKARQAFA